MCVCPSMHSDCEHFTPEKVTCSGLGWLEDVNLLFIFQTKAKFYISLEKYKLLLRGIEPRAMYQCLLFS